MDAFQRSTAALQVARASRGRERRARGARRTSSARARISAACRVAGACRRSACSCSRTPRRSLPTCRRTRSSRGARLDGPPLASLAGWPQKSLGVALDAVARADGVTLLRRRRRARARRARAPRTRARARRPRSLPRPAAARAGARALPRRRRVAPLLGLGELPAHGRRVARRRHAGALDARRRRRRGGEDGGTACSSRAGDAAALAAAIRRFFGDPGCASALAGGGRAVGRRLRARRDARPARSGAARAPPREEAPDRRADALPAAAAASLERKFARARRDLDVRVLASARRRARRATPRSGSAAPLPGRSTAPRSTSRSRSASRASCGASARRRDRSEPVRGARGSRRAGLARSGRALVVELHGDWRTFTRLYGSPLRRALAPLADRIAPSALRRADAVRTLSPYTTGLAREAGVEPAAAFPAFIDLEPFSARRLRRFRSARGALRRRARALQERRRARGRLAARRGRAVPEARLRLVGDGHRRDVVEDLVAELPERRLDAVALADGGRGALDDAVGCSSSRRARRARRGS